MSDPAKEEPAHHPERENALLRRTAELASLVADTEDQIAATLEEVALHRPPADAARLRAMAADAREHAAKERARAASYGVHGGDEPESRESRREQIGQRLEAIRTRVDELHEERQGKVTPAGYSERLVSAQHRAAISQAAAEQATDASALAYRRTADSHERAALQHERAAAAGFGDKDEHERQAAIHRAAAAADAKRAKRERPDAGQLPESPSPASG